MNKFENPSFRRSLQRINLLGVNREQISADIIPEADIKNTAERFNIDFQNLYIPQIGDFMQVLDGLNNWWSWYPFENFDEYGRWGIKNSKGYHDYNKILTQALQSEGSPVPIVFLKSKKSYYDLSTFEPFAMIHMERLDEGLLYTGSPRVGLSRLDGKAGTWSFHNISQGFFEGGVNQ